MPRPKLYFTKAQRWEANRLKNRRFYHKFLLHFYLARDNKLTIKRRNCTDILDSRRQKRELEQKAQERLKHEQRRKKQEKAKKKKLAEKTAQHSQQTTEVEHQYPTRTTLVSESCRHVEERLQMIQECYLQQVTAAPRCFVEKLCRDALHWKLRTHSPIAPRDTPVSPVTIDRECFQTMLDEFQRLSKEYFMLFKGEAWTDWDDRWAIMMEFQEKLAKMLETLSLIEVELEMGEEVPTLEDLTLIFDSQYS